MIMQKNMKDRQHLISSSVERSNYDAVDEGLIEKYTQ